jgi:hypothetical protein
MPPSRVRSVPRHLQELGEPIVIAAQGARPFGGCVAGDPAIASIRCDHGYVEYQIPPNPRRYPLVLTHGSSTKTWETTFDGRDGFKNIFLRRGFSTYMTDLPRVGRAGQGCAPTAYQPQRDNDQRSFNSWRLGTWLPGKAEPTFYPNVQFPTDDPDALDEFFRIQYPEFRDLDNLRVETDALAILLEEVGPSILLSHSSSANRGWVGAIKGGNVAAIVAYEPGDYVFPEDEMPEAIPRADGTDIVPGPAVSRDEFDKLTKMPIQIVWADFIPAELDPANTGPLLTLDNRRVNVGRSRLFAEAINRHGGNAEILVLPEFGIHGNTHFPMLDLNNLEIADLLSKFFEDNRLDIR